MNNMIWTDSEVYMGKGTKWIEKDGTEPIYNTTCLLYTSPSPRDRG